MSNNQYFIVVKCKTYDSVVLFLFHKFFAELLSMKIKFNLHRFSMALLD